MISISYRTKHFGPGLSAGGVDDAILLGRLGRQALLAEGNLTPKPGLVDTRGINCQNEPDLQTMHRSAGAIEPYFCQLAQTASQRIPSSALFEELVQIGKAAEQAVFCSTYGINCHKGAIWSLGLLISAASMQGVRGAGALQIAATAGSIASFCETEAEALVTHGRLMQQRYRVSGARGEAQQSFPHVTDIGLPLLRRRRAQGASETVARLDCLLAIMSWLEDTCLLYRGGLPAIALARDGARAVIEAGGAGTTEGLQKLHDLDKRLKREGWSPGGSADLLAATLLLDAIERGAGQISSPMPVALVIC